MAKIGRLQKSAKIGYWQSAENLRKFCFSSLKPIFAIPWGNSQYPNWISAKIVFFVAKTDFRQTFYANIFTMSPAISPWVTVFESHFF
jgi:hypothetical protein